MKKKPMTSTVRYKLSDEILERLSNHAERLGLTVSQCARYLCISRLNEEENRIALAEKLMSEDPETFAKMAKIVEGLESEDRQTLGTGKPSLIGGLRR